MCHLALWNAWMETHTKLVKRNSGKYPSQEDLLLRRNDLRYHIWRSQLIPSSALNSCSGNYEAVCSDGAQYLETLKIHSSSVTQSVNTFTGFNVDLNSQLYQVPLISRNNVKRDIIHGQRFSYSLLWDSQCKKAQVSNDQQMYHLSQHQHLELCCPFPSTSGVHNAQLTAKYPSEIAHPCQRKKKKTNKQESLQTKK